MAVSPTTSNNNREPSSVGKKRSRGTFAPSHYFLEEWPGSTKPRNLEASISFLTTEENFSKKPRNFKANIAFLTDNENDIQFNLGIKEIDSLIHEGESNEAIHLSSELRKLYDADSEKKALIYLREAYCNNELGQFSLANDRCLSALNCTQNEETVAFIQMRQAYALYGSKKYEESLIGYAGAISFFQKERRHVSILYTLLIEKSRLLYQLDRKEDAKVIYQEAQTIKDQVHASIKTQADAILSKPNAAILPLKKAFVSVSYETALRFSDREGEKPPNLRCFPLLQSLILSKNNLSLAPDCTRNPLLYQVDMSRNKFTYSPDLTENEELVTINFSHNQIALPPNLQQNTKLKFLNLSTNELTTPPDLRRNRNLVSVYFAHNQLTFLDLTENPELEKLNMSQNNFEVPPDLTKNGKLTLLDLSHNVLSEPPDLTLNPLLLELDLSSNQLNQAPDLSNNLLLENVKLSANRLESFISFDSNPKLQVIDLSENGLGVPPSLLENKELITLNLYENALTESPDLRNNRELRSLDLGCNDLTVAPDLSQNKELRFVSLSHNKLTRAPEVTSDCKWTQLGLTGNLLKELPDSILTLSQDCKVHVMDNQFTEAYIQDFQRRLQQHRLDHPGQGPNVSFLSEEASDVSDSDDSEDEAVSLSDELTSWSNEFKQKFPSLVNELRTEPATSLLQFNEADEEVLGKFLKKMREIPDYKDPRTKKNILLQVENILQLACKNGQFRDAMLLLVREGVETCADRTLIYFNKIEILYKFHDKSLTDGEFKQLALGAVKFDLLVQHGRDVCERRGGKKDLKNDEIEIILYFLVKLKESLVLPFTTKFMAFEKWAHGTTAMLEEAKMKVEALSDLELLQQSGYWLERMKEKFPEIGAEIENTYGSLMDEASDYFQLKEEEQPAFLETHQELQKFLTGPDREKINMKDYNAVMRVLARKKDEAIASLKN